MKICVRETNINSYGVVPPSCFSQALQRAAPKWVEARVVRNGESVLYVHHGYLDNFVRLCRDSMLFQIKVLIDLCCIDYPFREQRFSLVYMLCSVHEEEYCSEATLLLLLVWHSNRQNTDTDTDTDTDIDTDIVVVTFPQGV